MGLRMGQEGLAIGQFISSAKVYVLVNLPFQNCNGTSSGNVQCMTIADN